VSQFNLSLRWRRRIVRAYELLLCAMLLGIAVSAGWPN